MQRLLPSMLVCQAAALNFGNPPEYETDALSHMFNELGGRYWTDSQSWRRCRTRNKGTDISESWLPNCTAKGWRGVEIRKGHVVGLNLSRSNLQGPLSKSICNLRKLRCVTHAGQTMTRPGFNATVAPRPLPSILSPLPPPARLTCTATRFPSRSRPAWGISSNSATST